MNKLGKEQIKKLKAMAHELKPVVHIGQKGITESLVTSFEKALDDHELIKAKFIDFKDEKKELTSELAEKCSAHIVNIIGNIAIFYRENPDRENSIKI